MNVKVTAMLAALKRGFLKNRTFSMGWVQTDSHHRNSAITTSPTAKPASTSVELHPLVGPSMTAHSTVPVPAIDSTAPNGSSRGDSGSFDVGMNMYPKMRAVATIGTFTRRIE